MDTITVTSGIPGRFDNHCTGLSSLFGLRGRPLRDGPRRDPSTDPHDGDWRAGGSASHSRRPWHAFQAAVRGQISCQMDRLGAVAVGVVTGVKGNAAVFERDQPMVVERNRNGEARELLRSAEESKQQGQRSTMMHGYHAALCSRLARVAALAGLGVGPTGLGCPPHRRGPGRLARRRQPLAGGRSPQRPRGLARPAPPGRASQAQRRPEALDPGLPLAWPGGLWLPRRALDLPARRSSPDRGVRRHLLAQPGRAPPQGPGLDAASADHPRHPARRGGHRTLGRRGLAGVARAGRGGGPHAGFRG
jgi:hypothetical protein